MKPTFKSKKQLLGSGGESAHAGAARIAGPSEISETAAQKAGVHGISAPICVLIVFVRISQLYACYIIGTK